MTPLYEEYEITMDAKGRCLLPADLRKLFENGEGDCFVLNRGFNGCLNVFPLETWNKRLAEVLELDDYDEDAVTFKRLFLSGATKVAVDSADRILIPKNLQETAHIKKDAVLRGMGNKLELWDRETYYNFLNKNADNYSKLGKTVMGKKPDNQTKS